MLQNLVGKGGGHGGWPQFFGSQRRGALQQVGRPVRESRGGPLCKVGFPVRWVCDLGVSCTCNVLASLKKMQQAYLLGNTESAFLFVMIGSIRKIVTGNFPIDHPELRCDFFG